MPRDSREVPGQGDLTGLKQCVVQGVPALLAVVHGLGQPDAVSRQL